MSEYRKVDVVNTMNYNPLIPEILCPESGQYATTVARRATAYRMVASRNLRNYLRNLELATLQLSKFLSGRSSGGTCRGNQKSRLTRTTSDKGYYGVDRQCKDVVLYSNSTVLGQGATITKIVPKRAAAPTGIICRFLKSTLRFVRQIRAEYKPGVRGFGQRALSKKFGIHQDTIRQIALGITWRHVK